MVCEHCRGIKHHSRCPLYKSKSISYYCSICNDEINYGEQYIVNDDGEYAHTECFSSIKRLIEWLGYEIKEMECENDEF